MPAKEKFPLWIHVKGIIIVTLIGTAISLSFSNLSNLRLDQLLYSLLYCFMIGSTLWIGNYSIDPMLERIFRKKPLNPGQKLVLSLVFMLLVSSFNIFWVNWLWVYLFRTISFAEYFAREGSWIMIIEITVVIIIALVLYTNDFFHSWRDAVKSEEALKREKLALQYESLKNQVNPHFLFNSLNTLSGLIGKDDEKATLFVKQLSDIYRYVLEQKDRELVTLNTEMGFVQNYISLMKIRFGSNLQVETNINQSGTIKVIPLSVQMLIENAIKHNIVSIDKPLNIRIFTDDEDRLVVKNNLQKKSSIMQDSTEDREKHGLENIRSRYEYLSQGNFEVNGASGPDFPEEKDGEFIVKLPLIK